MSDEFCAELLCTFEKKDRNGLPANSLNSNTAVITAWSNDFNFDDVFARQIKVFGRPEDILVTFSTSGKSKNIVRAQKEAKKLGMIVIPFPIKGSSTASIQEWQHKEMHTIAREVEGKMFR